MYILYMVSFIFDSFNRRVGFNSSSRVQNSWNSDTSHTPTPTPTSFLLQYFTCRQSLWRLLHPTFCHVDIGVVDILLSTFLLSRFRRLASFCDHLIIILQTNNITRSVNVKIVNKLALRYFATVRV